MSSLKSMVIVVLVVAAGALAYLYYQETKSNVTVKINLPNIQIDKK